MWRVSVFVYVCDVYVFAECVWRLEFIEQIQIMRNSINLNEKSLGWSFFFFYDSSTKYKQENDKKHENLHIKEQQYYKKKQ